MALKVRSIFTLFGAKVDRRSFRNADKAVNGLKRSVRGLAAIVATGVVARGFGRMTKAASDAQETMNIIGEVFKDSADTVIKESDRMARTMGRSSFTLREFSGRIGAIIQPMIGARDVTAQMSTRLAEAAVDLGSFFNTTDIDALEALESGLTGQIRPLRRFGVNMTVAALEAFALAQGQTKLFKQMTEGEKTTLRYNFILSQIGNATGDAARTTKQFANSFKAFKDSVKDVATRIGLTFLPGVEKLLLRLRELSFRTQQWVQNNEKFLKQRMNKVLGKMLDFVVNLGNGLKDIAIASRRIFNELSPASRAMASLAAGAFLFAGLLALPGGALLILLGLIALLIEDWKVFTEGGQSLLGDMVGEMKGFIELFPELADTIALWLQRIGIHFENAIQFWFDLFNVGFFEAVERRLLRLAEQLKSIPGLGKAGELLETAVGGSEESEIAAKRAALRASPSRVGTPEEIALARIRGQAGGGGATTINQTINAAPGMDETILSNKIEQKTKKALDDTNRQALQQLTPAAQ